MVSLVKRFFIDLKMKRDCQIKYANYKQAKNDPVLCLLFAIFNCFSQVDLSR